MSRGLNTPAVLFSLRDAAQAENILLSWFSGILYL